MKRRRQRDDEFDPFGSALGPEQDDYSIYPGGTRLGEILVDLQLVHPQHIVAVLAEHEPGEHKPLGRRLVERGIIGEYDIARAVAHRFSLELVDLGAITPDPSATKLLDEPTARSMVAIPLQATNDRVFVAVAVPSDRSIAALQRAIGRPVVVKVAAHSDILAAIASSYRALTGVSSQIRAFEAQQAKRDDAEATPEISTVSEDAPVVQVVQRIITQALRDRASDIHIEPQTGRVRVRYRIDGALHDVLELPVAMGPALSSRIKILANMNIVERRRAQDGQISMEVDGRSVDIRVATTGVIEGEKVVMRLLDKSRSLYRLDQLGMPDDMIAIYAELLRTPYGMVICAGPTGSGKTTTLYGSLGEINSPERNVMTIEDPVEYRIQSINQIQINEQAGITFATGLRSILRLDPDVILVGEIRDAETARIAVQSALTGHFVLSSLHATDAPAALHRLLDMGIESFLIASSVTAVVAQRLVRRICTHCRAPYEPPRDERAFLSSIRVQPPMGGFLRGYGCNFCAQTGYLERIGVYELMLVSDAIRDLVVDRATHEEMRKVARSEGMRTLGEEAARLVEAGVTTIAEVVRSIYAVGG
ncbi:MAG TPA: GspE/PulE family protein [Micromonosporaceae bacterium]|nr:GspE/PulE family protein [Micromonosporaceae bacterium]